MSSSYEDTSHIGLGPYMNSFYINYLFKGSVSKYSHILRYWGLEVWHMNLEGMQFSPYQVSQLQDWLLTSLTQIKDNEWINEWML